jgi:hypothetical protein
MDKKIAGLLGAVAGLATAGGVVQAAPVANYADLLAPVPNAVAALKADEAARAQQAQAELPAGAQLVQYHHHHHHHHHRTVVIRRHHHHHRRYYHHHHHHHHHHSGVYLGVPGAGVYVGH